MRYADFRLLELPISDFFLCSMFSDAELRQLRALKTPVGIQRFLDAMPYHLAPTAWSPRVVLRERTAHCLEGAIFAAAALRVLGYPPLLLDLEADQDTDHVLAIFKERGHWGAVAKSNFTGCRYREPVYRTLRELALSYFHIYFNLRAERTLRRYSRPVSLARFDRDGWMTSREEHLVCAKSSLRHSRTRRSFFRPNEKASLASILAPYRAKWLGINEKLARRYRASCEGASNPTFRVGSRIRTAAKKADRRISSATQLAAKMN